MNEITPASLHEWMKKNRYRQARIAEKLGTSATTVSRWLSGVHDIPAAEKMLLAYLIHGRLPFDTVAAASNYSNKIPFREDEWNVIRTLAHREGFESAETWIATKIRIYLHQLPEKPNAHCCKTAPPVKTPLEALKSSQGKSA